MPYLYQKLLFIGAICCTSVSISVAQTIAAPVASDQDQPVKVSPNTPSETLRTPHKRNEAATTRTGVSSNKVPVATKKPDGSANTANPPASISSPGAPQKVESIVGTTGDVVIDLAIKKAKPVIETTPSGKVNFTSQFVEAIGRGVLDTARFKNKAQAKALAIRGATVDAQRNLLETIKGVHVSGQTTVQDMMTTSDMVVTSVSGIIRGATPVGPPRISTDGMVEVTLRVPLYGSNGLGPIVADDAYYPEMQKTQAIADVSNVTNPDGVTPIPAIEGMGASVSKITDSGKPIAFNVLNKSITPTMFPVVLDRDGNVVFDSRKIYDPTKGQFPKFLQASKDVMAMAGFKKGVDLVDVIQNSDGKFTLANTKTTINWGNVGKVAAKIGKVLLMFI